MGDKTSIYKTRILSDNDDAQTSMIFTDNDDDDDNDDNDDL